MKEFLKSGKRRFTEKVFNSLSERISDVKADWEFLAAGFDSRQIPHLFTVEAPGTDSVYDRPGFCAIGSGRYAAEGILLYLGQNPTKTLYETVFNVYAGKFMAEKVGVGRHSYLFVKKAGSTTCAYQSYIDAEIRKEWEAKCAPRASAEFIEIMARNNAVRVL
jgi:hypothetical protein